MKKTLVSLALALAASMSMAADVGVDVGVSYIRDATLAKAGVRTTLSVPMANWKFTPQVSVTHVGGEYNRFGVGAEYAIVTLGAAKLAGTGSVVYQETLSAGNDNGIGGTIGLRFSVPVYKNVSVSASMEQFLEIDGVDHQSGTVYGLGLVAKF